VSGGSPEGLPERLRGQYDWLDAIREAEKSGDLTKIAALVRSGAYLGLSRDPLADLFDGHRLVRKKRGAWKSIFEPSAQEKYAQAAEAVRQIKKGNMPLVWLVNGDRPEAVGDPVEYVARKLGLDSEKLWNAMQGKTGFGRDRKPKRELNGSAPKWRDLWRFRRPRTSA
jgi:hypothetical protein